MSPAARYRAHQRRCDATRAVGNPFAPLRSLDAPHDDASRSATLLGHSLLRVADPTNLTSKAWLWR
jgi:hypothetical protein